MRSHDFLKSELKDLLEGAFQEMELMNPVEIKFGRRAKRRFGSIKFDSKRGLSLITINGLFRDFNIPEQIIRATIAHELCHYAHGFGSKLPQKYKHPHQGGVILMEMKKRGLEALYHFEKQWTKVNWPKVLQKEFPVQTRKTSIRTVRRKASSSSLERLLQKQLRKAFKNFGFLL